MHTELAARDNHNTTLDGGDVCRAVHLTADKQALLHVLDRQTGIWLAVGSRDGHIDDAMVEGRDRSRHCGCRPRGGQHDVKTVMIVNRDGRHSRSSERRGPFPLRLGFWFTIAPRGERSRCNLRPFLLLAVWFIQGCGGIIGGVVSGGINRRSSRGAIARNTTSALSCQRSRVRQ